MAKYLTTYNATIPSGATTSTTIPLNGARPLALRLPAAMTNTSLQFYGSIDGSDFKPIYDDAGSIVTIAVNPDSVVDLQWAGNLAPYVKLVGSLAEAADRSLAMVAEVEV